MAKGELSLPFQLCGRRMTLLLCLLALSCAFVCSAETFVVIETDGSIEDYAAITLFGNSGSSIAQSLRIISVQNTGWGYSASASSVVQRFVTLLPSLSKAVVTVGALETLSSTSQSSVGECVASRGFPATPFDSAKRGMGFSRADVSFAFSLSAKPFYMLPPSLTSPPTRTTYEELSKLVESCGGEDRIAYLQLTGSMTTLASILKRWEDDRPALLRKFLSIVDLHFLDMGHAGGSDSVSVSDVLRRVPNCSIKPKLYLRSFFIPGIQFTEDIWSAFEMNSQSSSSSAVEFLFRSWNRKKELVSSAVSANNFYIHSFPAGVLISLCAINENFQKHLCPSYSNEFTQVHYAQDPNCKYLRSSEQMLDMLSGDNVTFPYCYIGNATNSVPGQASVFNNVVPSDAIPSGSVLQKSLAETFWSTWLDSIY